MTKDDVDGIFACCQDERIWTHMSHTLQTREDVRAYIEQALVNREAGTEYPFVIVLRATNEIIGSTRFFDIATAHKHLEIGHTWLHPSFWRTNINTECKYLLLSYCFSSYSFNEYKLKQVMKIPNHKKRLNGLVLKKKGFYVII